MEVVEGPEPPGRTIPWKLLSSSAVGWGTPRVTGTASCRPVSCSGSKSISPAQPVTTAGCCFPSLLAVRRPKEEVWAAGV